MASTSKVAFMFAVAAYALIAVVTAEGTSCPGCNTVLDYVSAADQVLQQKFPSYTAQLLQGTGQQQGSPSESPDDFDYFTLEYTLINSGQHQFWVSFTGQNQVLSDPLPSNDPFVENLPINQPVPMTSDEAYQILTSNGYSSSDGYTLWEVTLRYPLSYPAVHQTYWIFDLTKRGETKYVGVGVLNKEVKTF